MRQFTVGRHKEALATAGYTVVPDVLNEEEIHELRSVLDALFGLYDPAIDYRGLDVTQGRPDGKEADGATMRKNFNWATSLVSKHSCFWKLIDREPALSLIRSVVGDDCVVSSMNSLEPLKGRGHQVLHRDEGPAGPGGYMTANAIWVLDDMDADNGATRFIPGTQDSEELCGDTDPRVVFAEAVAGSVVVANAHVLHAASLNRSGRRRRVIHSYFTRRGRPQQTNFKRYSSPAVLEQLSQAHRRLLGL